MANNTLQPDQVGKESEEPKLETDTMVLRSRITIDLSIISKLDSCGHMEVFIQHRIEKDGSVKLTVDGYNTYSDSGVVKRVCEDKIREIQVTTRVSRIKTIIRSVEEERSHEFIDSSSKDEPNEPNPSIQKNTGEGGT